LSELEEFDLDTNQLTGTTVIYPFKELFLNNLLGSLYGRVLN
jgi:hypothetical protein